MNKINVGRALLGGLLAGLVLNVIDGVVNAVILADQWAAARTAMGKPALFAVNQVIGFNMLGFAAGIVAVWLYAAMRSRFGAGTSTAVRAGLITWALLVALPNVFLIIADILPANLLGLVIAVGVIEYPLAVMAGGALYKEAGGAEKAAAAHA